MAPSAVDVGSAVKYELEGGYGKGKRSEMHTDVRTLNVNFESFFGVKPARVAQDFAIPLAEQSYLPKVAGPLSSLPDVQSL